MKTRDEEIRQLESKLAKLKSASASDTPPETAKKPPREQDGLHKRKRGIWHYALIVDGKRKAFSARTRNYQEARKVRAEAERALREGKLPNDLRKWLFEDLLAHVLETRKLHIAAGTAQLEKHRGTALLKHFRGKRVSTINAATIQTWQRKRVAEGVAGSTINSEAALLRAVLQAAKSWAAIEQDYKRLAEDRRGPGRALADADERLLLDTAKSRPGWEVAFYAAMTATNTTTRGIEVKSLRLRDLDLINREITIRRSKTDAGLRRIPLNDASLWSLARLLERAHALGATKPDHYLLPAFLYRSKLPNRGTGYDPTWHQKDWRTAWRALVRETARRAGRKAAEEALAAGRGLRAAIGAAKSAAAPFRGTSAPWKFFRFHDLRHTAITRLSESQASDQTIMSLAGHLNRSMLEHYSHTRSLAKRAAVDALPSYIPADEPPATAPTKRVQ